MASIRAAEQNALRDSVPHGRVELPFSRVKSSPAGRGKLSGGASALAREKDGAYAVIQRGHCKEVNLMSTKKGSGCERSPAKI